MCSALFLPGPESDYIFFLRLSLFFRASQAILDLMDLLVCQDAMVPRYVSLSHMPECFMHLFCTCISGMHQDNIISLVIDFTFAKSAAFIIPYIPCAFISMCGENSPVFKIRRPECESWFCSFLTL